jgi:hypothetical protein
MNPFKQRSSIPSSIVTSLVGWVGFIFVGPLIFGFPVSALHLFILGVCSALVQVAILRIGFFVFQMQRHILVGAFWGLITAVAMYYITRQFDIELKNHHLAWVLIYAYIGAPVGAFLSYFYIDDKKIFDENNSQPQNTNYGRDAHWLEPFGFGAMAYVIVFLPFAGIDVFVNVFIVGAISGVFAAGASHFSPDSWKQSYATLAIIILVVGGIQGFLTGLLLRSYSEAFYANHLILGVGSGVLTYLMTFARGRQLAGKEVRGEF